MNLITVGALEAVRAAPTLLSALHLGPALEKAVATDGQTASSTDDVIAVLLDAAADAGDQLTAALATLALGSLGSPAGTHALVDLLAHGPRHLRDQAVWALGRCPLAPTALPLLVEAVVGAGFTSMLAQRTLERWAIQHPDAVASALTSTLDDCCDPAERAAVVETLGLLPASTTDVLLIAVAGDTAEAPGCRAAAVAALGDTYRRAGVEEDVDAPAVERLLETIAGEATQLGSAARIALHDLARPSAAPTNLPQSGRTTGRLEQAPLPPADNRRLLTVGQVFLHADVDGDLSNAGRADTGGIATLLVQLGDALVEAKPPVSRVVTISRGKASGVLDGLKGVDDPGHHYLQVPLWGPNLPAAMAWPRWVATRRGLRRILRDVPGINVLHLRMGDVATLTAVEVAAEQGLPVVFTYAPDPNAQIASRDNAGTLTRSNFGEADLVEHLVFRERLLHDLQQSAAHLVLFPRPDLRSDMRSFMNLDVDAEADRVSVVAEGISLSVIENAAAQAAASTPSAALRELDDLLGSLPAERRRLPVVVSVGRLSRVKGMVTLVEAWAHDKGLSERCNLLVVGGDLNDPSDEEQQQLAGIDAVVPRDAAAQRGLLLAGHRRNGTVAAWLGAVRTGRPGFCAPAGVYVSASLKEEFGIAILEALASGLVVVAPDAGGPATYVSQAVTGILTDTASPARLSEAMRAALDLAQAPEADVRAAGARQMVRERFGIDSMADALARVYRGVADQHPVGRVPTDTPREGARS